MSIAGVPAYLGKDFKEASPGMRFGMYLQLWNEGVWTKIKGKPLDGAKRLNDHDQKTMRGLLERQRQAFDVSASSDASFRLDALATAPFTTGLGNEHPLENGFAFLNPYGLPYLPGSGVKGVLRQAARELACGDWGEAQGWNDAAVEILFGRESADSETNHLRGALIFWDVIPQIAPEDPKKPDQISLAVEIMTPHQGHYYQQKPHAGSVSPHESGQPTPISFLTVPPKSRFVFHVQCDLAHLERLAPNQATGSHWKILLEAAFQHAYLWLGFGAKTAVGYGAMQENPDARDERERLAAAARAESERQSDEMRRSSMSPEELAWEAHQPVVEKFRQQFESARQAAYNPGGLFNNQRNDFVNEVLTWEDTQSRQIAGQLLKATMTKTWGIPGNKDSKQRLKDAVAALCPGCE